MAELPEGLPKPARRALEQAGYRDLEQLSNISDSELLNLHGFDPKGLLMLKQAMADAGLRTAEDPQGARSAPASQGAKTGESENEPL